MTKMGVIIALAAGRSGKNESCGIQLGQNILELAVRV